MDNQVRYTVTANDMLSGKLQGMNTSAQALEGTMGGLSKILGTLGIGLAVFKGLDYLTDGIAKWGQLEDATAQVQAGIESTGGAAGMTMSSVSEMVNDMTSKMKYGKAELTDMASQMLSFGGITKENFPKIGEAIANVATKVGVDLHGMAIQFGKAMDNPADGVAKLSRQGVLFSDAQKDAIQKLMDKGELVKAQQIMLTEIQNKYGNSAQAAFDVDPINKFHKVMEGVQLRFGEIVDGLMDSLAPTLVSIAESFKNVGHQVMNVVRFFQKHNEISAFLAVTLGSIVGIIVIYNTQQKLAAMWTAFTTTSMIAQTFSAAALTAGMGGASIAGMTWAGVMGVVNAIMAANPVMLIVIGIGLLIGVVYEVIKHFHDWGAAITLLMGPFGLLISAIMSLYSHWQSIKDAFENGGIVAGLKRIGIVLLDTLLYPLQQVMEWVGKITGADWAKGAANSIKEMRKQMDLITPEETKAKTVTSPAGARKQIQGTKTETTALKAKEKSKEVSGNKVVTINVSIGNLINDFQIKTTNIQESASAIHDKVVQALTSAINDSQLIAGQ